MDRLVADTGYLVALARREDPCHASAQAYAARFSGHLVTTSPVIVEACHFLRPRSKVDLLHWAAAGSTLAVLEVPVKAYPELAATIRKYEEHNIDLADASLVWLASEAGLNRILTVDRGDFSTLRLKNGRRFEIVDWY